MSTIPPHLATAFAALPAAIRGPLKMALEAQCDGAWARVSVNPGGSFTVHNTPQEPPAPVVVATPAAVVAAKKAAPKKAAPKKAAAKAPATTLRGTCGYEKADGSRCIIRVPNPGDRCSLHDGSFGRPLGAAKVEPKNSIEPGVRVVLTRSKTIEESRRLAPEADPRGKPEKYVPGPDEDVIQNFDWDKVGITPVATRLRTLWKDGLPKDLSFTTYPDVLELQGVDLEDAISALHHPSHVEVRPESVAHGYPILGFWRGDVLSVLALRTPKSPQLNAAYFFPHAMHDTHRVNHTGGGGTKKARGLPTTVRNSLALLRLMGATVEYDELTDKVAPVQYKGQELKGKISVDAHTSRSQVEMDYQRVVRQMQAINRRTDKSS